MPLILAPGHPVADPFGEDRPLPFERRFRLLGADFRFRSADAGLLRQVVRAYAGLPRHRLAPRAPTIELRLLHATDDPAVRWSEPPEPRLRAGPGFLCGIVDAGNWIVLSPEARAGAVSLSPRMLRLPYHARHDLLDLAVYTLAARVLRLAGLHAACVARGRRAVLLMGASGAGKTTLSLHAQFNGLQFLCEDSAFVCPRTGCVSGLGSYVHVRADGAAFLSRAQVAALRQHGSLIRRRSGVRKLEVDMRALGAPLVPSAPRLAALVYLAGGKRRTAARLRPLGFAEGLARLQRLQPYAAAQPEWSEFARLARRLPHWELQLGAHPGDAIGKLRSLLAG